jgi:homoserine O-succinyltransferase
VKRHGYAVPIRSEKIGWTVAVRDRGCLFVLLQGHPEYSAGALLKEYRRDVRSYLEGGRSQYPRIPVHYFSAGAVKELEGFKRMATSGTAHPGLMSEFPFASAAKGINYVWERPAQQLFAGWLAEVRRRQALSAASLRAPL